MIFCPQWIVVHVFLAGISKNALLAWVASFSSSLRFSLGLRFMRSEVNRPVLSRVISAGSGVLSPTGT